MVHGSICAKILLRSSESMSVALWWRTAVMQQAPPFKSTEVIGVLTIVMGCQFNVIFIYSFNKIMGEMPRLSSVVCSTTGGTPLRSSLIKLMGFTLSFYYCVLLSMIMMSNMMETVSRIE